MQNLQQIFLSQNVFGCSHEKAYRRKTFQVWLLSQSLCPVSKPGGTSENSHRRETICLPCVWKTLLSVLLYYYAHAHSHWWAAFSVCRVWKDICRKVSFHKLFVYLGFWLRLCWFVDLFTKGFQISYWRVYIHITSLGIRSKLYYSNFYNVICGVKDLDREVAP